LGTAAGDVDLIRGESYPLWYMEMQDLGYNYRLTDFQAALGASQLKRAHQGIEKRREIALRYDEAFKNHPKIKSNLNELQGSKPSGHAYHLYIVQVEDRWSLYDYLRENDIIAQVHYIPAHLMPYYKQLGWKEGDMPCAESYYKCCISLPIYPTLLESEQNYVIETINKFYLNS
jgi:dTDP-4-amino-4,6-dideoxygalactose transaminase